MYSSQVIAALAAVGVASAASSTASGCSVSATTTISSAAEATALNSCTKFTGSIAIDPSVAGALTLDGIDQLDGDLFVENAVNLTSLSAPSMNSISGKMDLASLTILSTLSFPSLKSIGEIAWDNLPALQTLTFTDTVTSCPVISISDTQLNSLDGINLETGTSWTIANNRFLKTISTQMANLTGAFNIDSNGQDLAIELPNLVSAGSLIFRNTSSVSIPSLASVNGTLGFYENYLTTISAPNLTTVTGQLAFVANPSLSNITMDSLTTVQGFQIANNSALLKVDGFQSLKKITGALDVTGNFTSIELPDLTMVSGAWNMQSSGNITSDCDTFSSKKSSGDLTVTAGITCDSTSKNVQSGTGSDSGSGTSTGSSSSATSTKKSAAGQLEVPTAMGLIGGFLAMLL